ncbi:chemotaxis protein CheD [Methanogenium organophilum]|uniref:Probable chemoreceptor glutamine deamidase CheD n=1 Tax=Methanogenium organophilum TaxID=2199 RepID=A0A9X9S352_METOG|nr:chemotaxis protein CheD [Methanogenium organophilum]WAI01034.1 chemotaxis protein CheD [Methanogenium organophilum]
MDKKNTSGSQGSNVGIGDFKTGNTQISSIGLGSCVAFILYDRKQKTGGLAHVMLPESNGRSERPAKFADTAVPHLIHEMEKSGSSRQNLSAYLVGGASMFQQFKGNLDIGKRNVIALKHCLDEHHIYLESEDIGGTSGRSVLFYPEDGGKICIRRADGKCYDL